MIRRPFRSYWFDAQHRMMKKLVLTPVLALWALPAFAQEGALDVLDGETLYLDGWLVTAAYEFRIRKGLLDGSDPVGDPLHQREFTQIPIVSAHYGAWNTLQVGTIIPYVQRVLEMDNPGGPDTLRANGVGDVRLYGKWRYYRWHDVGKAMNFALLGGLELPTGKDDLMDKGIFLPADLQPGSASWGPFLETAVT